MIRQHFLAGVVGLKVAVPAAVLMVGVGQAEAATGKCDYSGHYDPPVYGTKVTYNFDVFVKQGFADREDNPIDAYGPYSKDIGVPMQAKITYLPEDYCADITLSSQGQAWETDYSSWMFGFFASGWASDGARFAFSLDYFEPDDFLDLEWRTGDSYAWLLLSIENVRVAPVPLPATAALLPVGLGALAMIRRRRRLC